MMMMMMMIITKKQATLVTIRNKLLLVWQRVMQSAAKDKSFLSGETWTRQLNRVHPEGKTNKN